MTQQQIKVIEEFSKLSDYEKKEILKLLIERIHGSTKLFGNLSESRMIGVTGNNQCPCCGKS